MVRKVVAGTVGLGAGALGLVAAALARSRRQAGVTADVWSRATRGVAERDLDPPNTVAVDSRKRPG